MDRVSITNLLCRTSRKYKSMGRSSGIEFKLFISLLSLAILVSMNNFAVFLQTNEGSLVKLIDFMSAIIR